MSVSDIFFLKQKTAYEIKYGLVGSEMFMRDSFLSYRNSISVTLKYY